MAGCFVGIFSQAIIVNLTAILFVPMMTIYGFDYRHLGILAAVNFITQVVADLSFSRVIDRIGYRRIVLPTCAVAAAGLLLYALTPVIFACNIFGGILLSTVIFAFSGGLLEIMLSPMVAAIPGGNKGPVMSLMHSFYAWGQAALIILTTIFIFVFGGEKWQIIVVAWAVVPAIAFFIFLTAPMPGIIPEGQRQGMSKLLFNPFYLLALAAMFFGAGSEIVMNQWASTLMEKGLAIPKLAGDLVGMCGFVILLGVGRVLHGTLEKYCTIHTLMIIGSVLAFVCYIVVALSPFAPLCVAACMVCGLAVSLLWPGTLVIASKRYPLAGAWMFAIMAVAGDVGGAFSSWLTGESADLASGASFTGNLAELLNITHEQAAIRVALLVATVFPLVSTVIHLRLKAKSKA